MKKRNFPWAIIAAAAVAGAGFTGVANYVRHNDTNLSNVTQNSDDVNGTSVGSDSLSGTNGLGKNTGTTGQNGSGSESQIHKVSKVDALNKAIKESNYNEKGIRVLDVTVENGNAIVDMNSAVRYNWGSEAEADFIDKMKVALTPFESVKTFQIRVDGEILKYLSHFEIDPVKVR